ncbi:MAG: MBL fold metallo-hydrolase [Firmicutes bacterium]|nr:MBL fold metallo-hydrolase [Bacillota bacterium]
MKIITVTSDLLSANTYIIYDEKSLDAVIIDAVKGFDKINSEIIDLNLKVRALLLTHGHFDHVWSAKKFQKAGATVYIHKDDADKLNVKRLYNFESLIADEYLREGLIKFGEIEVQVIFTPGHSKGGVCYLIENLNAIFTGDTLFKDCIGRSDFPDSSETDLNKSIKNKLFTYAKDYIVYPGHNETTSLFYERDNNPYID